MQFFITGIKDSKTNRGVFTANDFNPEDIVRSLKLVITNKFGLPYDIFYLTCGIGAAANVGIANSLYLGNIYGLSGKWYLSGIIGALVGAVWNFLMSSLITWRHK